MPPILPHLHTHGIYAKPRRLKTFRCRLYCIPGDAPRVLKIFITPPTASVEEVGPSFANMRWWVIEMENNLSTYCYNALADRSLVMILMDAGVTSGKMVLKNTARCMILK